MEQNSGIDFVLTWVDGNDAAWRKQEEEYSRRESGRSERAAAVGDVDDRDVRYRDYGLLAYWFRGVEKFAPWVRKIHFVTCGHLPKWLNTDNPKLHTVTHEDFIPNEFLPTFNCNPIELNLHRIEGLSEHFVYFNDDVFPIRSLKESDFFKNGKPCDMLAFQPVVANPSNPVMSHLFLNNALVLSKYFDKRENVRKQPLKYFKLGYPPLYFFYNLLELAFPKFTGFYTVHGAMPLCRKTYNELWEKEWEALSESSSHRFRDKDDLTVYLFREWQKLTGNFCAENVLKDLAYFEPSDNNRRLCETIRKQRKKTICINDSNKEFDFERTKKELVEVFEKILPERSSFEKSVSEDEL